MIGQASDFNRKTRTSMLCTICDEAVERHTETYCTICGNLFHLNQRTDLPGRDCGDAWISDQTLALEFGCQACIDGTNEPGPAAALDEIVDASEAAAWLGIAETEIVAAAEAGRVAYRRTGAGVYLFERQALMAAWETRP